VLWPPSPGIRLTRLIRESFELSERTYNSPRVWHDLKALGVTCFINRFVRLMKRAKLQARCKRRRLPGGTANRMHNHIAPNHLQRNLRADGPNQNWVADFTYSRMARLLRRSTPGSNVSNLVLAQPIGFRQIFSREEFCRESCMTKCQ